MHLAFSLFCSKKNHDGSLLASSFGTLNLLRPSLLFTPDEATLYVELDYIIPVLLSKKSRLAGFPRTV